MSAPTRGPDRVFRVLMLSGSSLLLAGGAHVVGGGGSPPAPTLALAALLVILVAAAITARRCRLPLLLFVVSAEQLGLHVIFGAGAVETVSPHQVCAPSRLLGHHHAVPPADCSPTALAAAAPDQAAVTMTVTHALAVLVTVWLLSRGEAWLWSAADLVIRAAAAAPALPRILSARPQLLALPSSPPAQAVPSPAAPRGPPGALWS